MKTIITLLLIILASTAHAQSNPATAVAEKIAQKMKDTLGLTGNEKQQIYLINMQLHENKVSVRAEQAGSDSLRIYLQRVENTRDPYIAQF
jgi:hypothetical protein